MTALAHPVARVVTLAPLSLRRNVGWTLAGNVVHAACQWGMIVAIVKLGSAALVGRFALALAITAPVVLFANLQLRAVQATDARGDYAFGDYLGLRMVTSAVALVAIAVLAAIYGGELGAVILAVGAAKCLDGQSDAYHGLMQRHDRMDRIARSLMFKSPMSLAAVALALYLTGDVLPAAIALAGVAAVHLALYDIPACARSTTGPLTPRFVGKTLAHLAWLAAPLGIVVALVSVNANVPRYFIKSLLGEDDLGVFAAIAYLALVGNTVVQAMAQASSATLARHYAAGDRASYTSLLARLVAAGAGIGLAGVAIATVAGGPLLSLLYRPEYARHHTLLAWTLLAAAVAFAASFLQWGITAARYLRVQAPLTALALATTAAACAVLVPRAGLVGAAQATLAGQAILLAGFAAVSVHAVRALRRAAAPQP